MNPINQKPQLRTLAFTLVEMLVVIAIIGILAALIFPAFSQIKKRAARAKVHNELTQIAAWIDAYHAKFGHYPPDNAGNPGPPVIPPSAALNPLYYELSGTALSNATYYTLDGRETGSLASASVSGIFNIGGFVNVIKQGASDDTGGGTGKAFVSQLPPDRYAFTKDGIGLLVSAVTWPANFGPLRQKPVGDFPPGLNPIRYNSSNPEHNPKSYDLWVDIYVGNETNRISNWNKTFEVVNPNFPEQ